VAGTWEEECFEWMGLKCEAKGWRRGGSSLLGWPSSKIFKFENGMELRRIDYMYNCPVDNAYW